MSEVYAQHNNTTPSAPAGLGSFAALVAGGPKRAASRVLYVVLRLGVRDTPHMYTHHSLDSMF